MDCTGIRPSGAVGMVLRIQFLRVKTFPPFFRPIGIQGIAIFFRKIAIVGLRRFEPRPCMTCMNTNPDRQIQFPTFLHPLSDNISSGADCSRIPFLIWAIPEVHVVVVIGENHNITCAHALIEFNQLLRIPVFSFPFIAEILHAEILRISIMR